MRSLVLIALMSAVLVTPSLAQTPAPTPTPTPTPSPAPPPTSAPPPAAGPTAARPSSASREACLAEIDPKSLTGPERRDAMRTCMRGRFEACRKEAAAQGVSARSGERREFVHRCMQQKS